MRLIQEAGAWMEYLVRCPVYHTDTGIGYLVRSTSGS